MFLFLDIDGVLNDHRRFANGYSPIMFEMVEHLNKILAACPDVEIVLSSAWRYSFSTAKVIETLLCVHGVNAYKRVHGRTSDDSETWSSDHPECHNTEYWSALGLEWRARQIREYARKYGRTHYVAIDDIDLGIPELVLTDGKVGLTAELADEVIRRFPMTTELPQEHGTLSACRVGEQPALAQERIEDPETNLPPSPKTPLTHSGEKKG